MAIGCAIAAPEAFGASFEEASPVEALELGAGLEGNPGTRVPADTRDVRHRRDVLTTRAGETCTTLPRFGLAAPAPRAGRGWCAASGHP